MLMLVDGCVKQCRCVAAAAALPVGLGGDVVVCPHYESRFFQAAALLTVYTKRCASLVRRKSATAAGADVQAVANLCVVC